MTSCNLKPQARQKWKGVSSQGCLLLLLCLSFGAGHAGDFSDIDQAIGKAEELAARGKIEEAELDYRNALSLTIAKFGSFHAATAGVNRRIATFLLEQNRLVEAERHLQKALVITSGYSPAAALNGEFRGVSVFCANALQNPDSLPGSFELADVLEGYANLYCRRGSYADAERLLKTCARILPAAPAQQPYLGALPQSEDSQARTRVVLQLASVQARQSKVVEAEQTLQALKASLKTRKETSSAELIKVLKALAEFYREQRRQSDAETSEAEAASLNQR